jgi:hypothetical protein
MPRIPRGLDLCELVRTGPLEVTIEPRPSHVADEADHSR